MCTWLNCNWNLIGQYASDKDYKLSEWSVYVLFSHLFVCTCVFTSENELIVYFALYTHYTLNFLFLIFLWNLLPRLFITNHCQLQAYTSIIKPRYLFHCRNILVLFIDPHLSLQYHYLYYLTSWSYRDYTSQVIDISTNEAAVSSSTCRKPPSCKFR